MPKLKLLLILLYINRAFSTEEPESNIDTIKNGIQNTKSGAVIVNAAFKVVYILSEYTHPGKVQELKKALINQQINILKTEEKLITCVAKNAYNNHKKDQLPVDCHQIAEEFAGFAGLERYHSFESEFNLAINDLPLLSEKESKNQGMSLTKKVVIGGVVVVGATAIFLVCAPIVVPGTIVAKAATVITVSIKEAAVTTVVKISATSSATKSGITTAAALVAERTDSIYKKSKENFDKLPLADKVIIIARAADAAELIHQSAEYIGPYVFESAEEELIKLTRMKEMSQSLRDRIKEAHFLT